MIKIDNLQLNNPFLAGPLAGITDIASRQLYVEMGAAMVYSEMVSCKGLIYGNKNTEQLLAHKEGEPLAYQIFGSDPETMKEAAAMLASRKNLILDINMGCPVPKVVGNGEGSALLKDIDAIYNIVSAVASEAQKPVTAKIRIGWDETKMVAVEAAKAIEAGGGAAVTVHGRTRKQMYTGKADWNQIAAVKKAVSIPVIGNGDIFSGEDAIDMMDKTGCDMVMIARGMLGNPWIFREALALWKGEEKPNRPTKSEKIDTIFGHLDLLTDAKGEYVAVREMRKHFGWYLKGEPGASLMRCQVNKATTIKDLKNMVSSFFERM